MTKGDVRRCHCEISRRLSKKHKLSVREIAAIVDSSKSTVHRYLTQRVPIKARVPPRTLAPADRLRRFNIIRGLLKEVDDRGTDLFPTACAVSKEAKRRGTPVGSAWTVRRTLAYYGVFCYVRPLSPKQLPDDAITRLKWCQQHRRSKLPAARIVFSDEKNFDLNTHGFRVQYRRPDEPQKRRGRTRFAGTVMVWGAIGKGYRNIIVMPVKQTDDEGKKKGFRLNSDSYIRRCLSPSVNELVRRRRVLMHDGARAHAAHKVSKYLAGKKVRVLEDWPARSPHLNPIENLWALLAARVSKRAPKDTDELAKFIREEFELLPQAMIDNLVLSFDRRVKRSIKAKGHLF